ncbi:MAG: CHASE2 domain-containing protein [Candidatus Omnitrophica bacterium]|nr:CHASE2 domain-containing protein [Candidatus Omnitrophota bacterium]
MKSAIKVLLVVIVSLTVLAVFSKKTLEKAELTFYDWRLKNSSRDTKPLPFVVIGITQNFGQVVGEPFSRKHYTEILKVLEREGASVIGFDIFFPQITDKTIDREFIEEIRKSQKVVLPVFSPVRTTKREEIFYLADGIRSSAPDFNSAAVSLGHINTLIDSDQVIRRVPAFIKTKDRVYPQISLEIVRIYRGEKGLDNIYPGKKTSPIFKNDGSIYVKTLPPETIERSFIPFEDVLEGRYPKGHFKNKVVLIGQTIVGAKNADLIPTPHGTQFGVIFQAAVLDNALSGNYIYRLKPSFLSVAIVATGIITGLIFLSSGVIGSTFLLIVLSTIFISFSLYLMRNGIFLDTVPFLIMFFSMYLCSLIYSLVNAFKKLFEKESALKVINQVEEEITDILNPSEITGLSGDMSFSGIEVEELIQQTPGFIMRTLLASLGIAAGVFIHILPSKKHQIITLYGDILPEEIEKLVDEYLSEKKDILIKRRVASEKIYNLLFLPVISIPTFKILGIFINKHPSIFSRTPSFSKDDIPIIHILSLQAMLAIQNSRLNLALQGTQKESIFRLSVAIEYRDRETGAHIHRVSAYAELIAKSMGFSSAEAALIRNAMPLHDIGKIAIPDYILLKPGKLTPQERKIIEQHSIIGARMLEGSNSIILKAAESIALYHHERYNGSGYPFHLKGNSIPIYGRIAAIADVLDAMTSQRVYHAAIEMEEVLSLLKREAGSSFDPVMVNSFLERMDEIIRIKNIYRKDVAV